MVQVSADLTNVIPGGSAKLACNASGFPTNFTFSWLFEDALLSGETSPTLNLSSFTIQNMGSYTCQVSNSQGVGANNITIDLGGE